MKKIKLVLFAVLFVFSTKIFAQSLTGVQGLMNVPEARFLEDKEISFGLIYLDKKYQPYSDCEYNILAGNLTVAFLPFMEISLRINRMLDFPKEKDYTFDRVPTIRFLLLKEKKYRPSVVLGTHDFMWAFGGTDAIHYNATYLVATKNFKGEKIPVDFRVTLGYADDILEANDYLLDGVFGGLAVSPIPNSEICIEYDTFHVNIGLKYRFFNRLELLAGLVQFDSFCSSVSYRMKL